MASAVRRRRSASATSVLESPKPVTKRKSNKSKKRVTTEVKVMPRLRLEPRLFSEPEDSVGSFPNSETVPVVEKTEQNEPESYSYVPFEDGPIEEMEEQIGERIGDMISNGLSRESPSNMIVDQLSNMSPVVSSNTAAVRQEINEDSDESMTINTTPKFKCQLSGLRTWSDRELMALTTGLQSYGFAELDKVAEAVKTKSAEEVRQFVKQRINEVSKKGNTTRQKRGRGRTGSYFSSLVPEYVTAWPAARKWRKTASDQMLSCVRSKDYSRLVMTSLFKKFYEEEEESTDSQAYNVKAMYKSVIDCLNGQIPAALPPKESAVMANLIEEVWSMSSTQDFGEELKFLKTYKGALKFRPFHVKDEFKKRFTTRAPEDPDGHVVSVPENVFLELSRHKRIVQSFNPLVTPAWLLSRDQEILGDHIIGNVNK